MKKPSKCQKYNEFLYLIFLYKFIQTIISILPEKVDSSDLTAVVEFPVIIISRFSLVGKLSFILIKLLVNRTLKLNRYHPHLASLLKPVVLLLQPLLVGHLPGQLA